MHFRFSAQTTTLIVSIFLLLFTVSASAQSVLKISSADVPPFVYKENIPSYGCGLGCDIVTKAFRAVSQDADMHLIPMTRAIWSLIEHKSTANLGLYRWFEVNGYAEQVEKVDILTMNLVLFYKKNRFPDGVHFSRLSDLSPYTISCLRGTFMAKAYQTVGLNISYSTRVEQNIMKLEADRVDLAIVPELAGWQIIRDRFPEQTETFMTVKKTVATQPLSLIFRKEDHQLRAEFLRGLKMIVADGTYEAILTKYYRRAGMNTGRITQNIPLYLRIFGTGEKVDWRHQSDASRNLFFGH